MIKFLVQHKKFGAAQNILRPVKGQGIRAYCPNIYTVPKMAAGQMYFQQINQYIDGLLPVINSMSLAIL